jgi:hypothetical protein
LFHSEIFHFLEFVPFLEIKNVTKVHLKNQKKVKQKNAGKNEKKTST